MSTPSAEDKRFVLGLLRESFEAQAVPEGPHVVDDDTLLMRWADGRLSSADRDTLIEHLSLCPSCRTEINLLVEIGALDLSDEEAEEDDSGDGSTENPSVSTGPEGWPLVAQEAAALDAAEEAAEEAAAVERGISESGLSGDDEPDSHDDDARVGETDDQVVSEEPRPDVVQLDSSGSAFSRRAIQTLMVLTPLIVVAVIVLNPGGTDQQLTATIDDLSTRVTSESRDVLSQAVSLLSKVEDGQQQSRLKEIVVQAARLEAEVAMKQGDINRSWELAELVEAAGVDSDEQWEFVARAERAASQGNPIGESPAASGSRLLAMNDSLYVDFNSKLTGLGTRGDRPLPSKRVDLDAIARIEKLDSITTGPERSLTLQHQFSRLQIELGNGDRAEAILSEIVSGGNADAATYRLLGLALFTQKKFTDAAAAFKQTSELNPSDVDALLSQAISLEAAGQDARPIWKQLRQHEKVADEIKVVIDLDNLTGE